MGSEPHPEKVTVPTTGSRVADAPLEGASAWLAEPELVNEEGRYTPAPPFPNGDGEEDTPTSADDERSAHAARAILHARDKAALVDEVLALRERVNEWEAMASDMVGALALAPDSTAMYARLLRALLRDALHEVTAIDALRHVECSLPSLPGERPSLSLARWQGLEDSEWLVAWAPTSWWVSVSAVGSRWGIGFNALTRCSAIEVRGRLRVALAPDLTALRATFVSPPSLSMDVRSRVGWGIVPLPVQQQIEGIVRDQLRQFVADTLVGDQGLVIVLRRKANELISEDDVREAIEAAKRANSVRLST